MNAMNDMDDPVPTIPVPLPYEARRSGGGWAIVVARTGQVLMLTGSEEAATLAALAANLAAGDLLVGEGTGRSFVVDYVTHDGATQEPVRRRHVAGSLASLVVWAAHQTVCLDPALNRDLQLRHPDRKMPDERDFGLDRISRRIDLEDGTPDSLGIRVREAVASRAAMRLATRRAEIEAERIRQARGGEIEDARREADQAAADLERWRPDLTSKALARREQEVAARRQRAADLEQAERDREAEAIARNGGV
jgi:hypothetical protein